MFLRCPNSLIPSRYKRVILLKWWTFLSDCNEIWIFLTGFNNRFHENLSTGSWVGIGRRTDLMRPISRYHNFCEHVKKKLKFTYENQLNFPHPHNRLNTVTVSKSI